MHLLWVFFSVLLRSPVEHRGMALQQLRRDGEVRVRPEAFTERAARSSFVGAVLVALDDVEALTGLGRVV